jgi:hypothetical protein
MTVRFDRLTVFFSGVEKCRRTAIEVVSHNLHSTHGALASFFPERLGHLKASGDSVAVHS